MQAWFETLAAKTHIPVEVFAVAMTLIVGAVVIRIIEALVRKMLEKSSLDESAHFAILRTVRIACWVLLGLSAITAAGVDPSPYIAVLASVGAALALALQDSLKNVAGGIIILFAQPFVKGDEIEIEGTSGIVDFIDIMVTRIHTFNNKIVTIPNSKMVNCILINKTREDIVRVDCKFGVAYNSDLEKVKFLLNNIVKEGEILLDDPEPVIGVAEYAESAIIWDVMVWTRTENRFKAKYYLGEEVKNVFQKSGIEIPYPHVDVMIQGEK